MSSDQKTQRMSGKDVEATEVSTTAPEEAAPVVEGGRPQDTSADSAQAVENMGTQTPPLKGPETPELTGSPTTDSGYAEAALCQEPEEGEDQRALRAALLWRCRPLQSFSQLDPPPAQSRLWGQTSRLNLRGKTWLAPPLPWESRCYPTSCA